MYTNRKDAELLQEDITAILSHMSIHLADEIQYIQRMQAS